jgi:uncharacterized protein YcbX
MAHIENLRIYPVKGLDGMAVEESRVLDGGTLAHDREFALFDEDGDVMNGKRSARVHELDTDFDPSTTELDVQGPDGTARVFRLDADADRASAWFSDFFDVPLSLERDSTLGYVDRRAMGPSVISTATLEAVADWFDDLTVESARRRLRANVEVGGVPAFWEDRFVGEDVPSFDVGGVRFDGVTPCGRCVVPSRDPDTGEALPEFRDRFIERRRETFPEWADESAFDHFYSLMVITSVPQSDRGETIRAGDSVSVLDR